MEQIDLSDHTANLEMLNIFYNECRCEICKLLFQQPVTITCGHSFCRGCIQKSIVWKPQCPVCLQLAKQFRYPIFCDAENLRENILVKSISQEVGNLFKTQNNQKDKQRKSQQKPPVQNNLKEIIPHQSYIVIFTNQTLVPYCQQTVTLNTQQFKGISLQQVMKLFKSDSIALLANPVKGNQKLEIAYITIIKGVYLEQSSLFMRIMIQDIMQITQIQSEVFQVFDQALNLQTAKGKIDIDNSIEFSQETDSQIQFILDSIRENILLHLPKELNSGTAFQIIKYIESLGILQIMNTPDIKRNFKMLKQLSYVLPSILQLNKADVRRINGIFGVIERLTAISKVLEKFKTIANPLMVFKVPGTQQRDHYQLEFLVICLILFMAFYYRMFGI